MGQFKYFNNQISLTSHFFVSSTDYAINFTEGNSFLDLILLFISFHFFMMIVYTFLIMNFTEHLIFDIKTCTSGKFYAEEKIFVGQHKMKMHSTSDR